MLQEEWQIIYVKKDRIIGRSHMSEKIDDPIHQENRRSYTSRRVEILYIRKDEDFIPR